MASFVDFGRVLCSVPYPEDHEGWADPERKWALEYLKTACAGFDTEGFQYTGTNKNALWYVAKVGDEEAAEVALRDIHRTDNMLEVGVASVFLVERNLFPDQAAYGLSKDEMLKLVLMAGKLQTCAAFEACGSNSLITAELCARIGCRPGTTYDQAVRRDLSPREYEILKKVRQTMAET